VRALIQRVSEASVTIEGTVRSSIGQGFLILLGIEQEDDGSDMDWLVNKIVQMRIFSDEEGHMNVSLKDVDGELLVVSQFTLHASTKKGNRPSFIKAARPEQAIPLYEGFIKAISEALGKAVGTGEFGASMQVALINDGPVTIWIDSKNRD
jgi:D-tyrosyl-tRNA(Tyr) deacylase